MKLRLLLFANSPMHAACLQYTTRKRAGSVYLGILCVKCGKSVSHNIICVELK